MKRSNLLTKCIAIMLTFTMMAGLVNVPAITTEAKSGDKITISLSDINWSGDSYKFGTVNANITSGTQHILCIKVSKGSFNIGSNLGTSMSGIKYNPDNNETEDDYTSAPTTSDKLKLLTVKGDFSAEQVASFIKNITFNREGIADDAEQKVNVIASEIKLGPNETAMVLEDNLHIYRYVNWKDSTYRSDVDNTGKYTYFTAYNEAKAAEHEGLNGYLATITEDYEHDFIYNDVSKKSSWVGGARTFTNGSKFTNGDALDADTISEAAIVPGTASRELGKQCLDWLWICGPEAGDVFYRLKSSQQGAGDGDVPDEKYANWNPGEPNNTYINSDEYNQEYCLEYGFGSDHGKWNDWDPKVTLRNLDNIESQWSVSGYIVEFSPYESKTTNKTYKFDDNYTPVSEVVIVKKSGKIIEANDYSISLADAKNSTKDSVITKSDARVTSGGVKDNSAVITLSDADLNKIKNAKAGDVVEVTLTSDGATPKTIKVTVTGENPSITAHDFLISKTDAAGVNDSKVRDLSDAKGTKTDGSNSDPITVDSNSINNIKNAKVGDSVDVKLTNPNANEKTTTVKATVFDAVTDNVGGTGNSKNEMIGANGYTVNGGGVAETVNSVISKSAAKALDKDGKNIDSNTLTVNAEDLAKLNKAIEDNKEDVVNVRISTPNGTTVTIPVTVKAENPSIAAHDFLISRTDAANVNDDKVRSLSDAKGTKTDGSNSNPITVDGSAISNIKNAEAGSSVDVKLTNPDAPIKTTTVKAKIFDVVTDNTGGTGDAKDEMIGGNGYTVPKGKTSQSASDVLNNGAVTAIDPQGNPITLNDGSVNTEDLKKLNDAIKAGKDTVVDVTVSTPNGTSVKIPVTVKGEVAFPNITANDFFISKTDAAKITDTVAKSNSNATVYDKNGKAVSNPAISIDNLNSVKTTASGNSTTITFKSNVDGKDVTDTAIVTVFDNANNGKGSDGSVVSIGANNFVLTVEQASNPASALQSLAKQLSGVKALDDDDAVNISSINADVSNIKPVENLDGYDVTFEYMGVKTTVKAIVKDTSVKKDTITAQSFFISKTDAATCDDDKTKYYSHVSAKDPNGNPISDEKIKVSGTSDIKKANAGDIVPVSFSTDTATTNVSAKVFDSAHNGTGNSGKHVSIGANDYELTIAQAGNTSTLDSVSKSLAKVAALSKGANVDVNSIAIDTSKIKAEAGVYDVTFSYDGAVITVKATVKDGDALSPSGDANKVTVTANDKEVVRGTDPLTKKQLLDYINATGITDLGENVDVTVSDEDIKKFNDALKDPSVPSIKITVTDNNGNSTDVIITFKDADGTVGQDKVFEISNPTDVIEIVDKNKKVTAVTVDGTPIPTDSYTVTDDKLIIDDDFFKKYDPDTSHKVVVTYDDGTDMDFNVYIIEYNDDTVSKIVPVMKMVKEIIKGQKFKLNLKGIASNCSKIYQSDNKKVATISKKGVIKGKKYGTAHVNAYVIQNGSYYKVEVTVKVKKKSKRIGKNYNLKKKAVVSVGGNLPEFNVYKRVYKKKKTTLSFKDVQVESADAISFYIPKKYKKEKKNIKIGKVKYDAENGVASCKIKGFKKGFTHLTCRIEQNDQVYYTRIFVRVDDGTKNKKLKTYLK